VITTWMAVRRERDRENLVVPLDGEPVCTC
jgi:hypothetical protein